MDGLSRWDLVLSFVVAYAAVMILVRLMLNHRETVSAPASPPGWHAVATEYRGPAGRRTPRRRLSAKPIGEIGRCANSGFAS